MVEPGENVIKSTKSPSQRTGFTLPKTSLLQAAGNHTGTKYSPQQPGSPSPLALDPWLCAPRFHGVCQKTFYYSYLIIKILIVIDILHLPG